MPLALKIRVDIAETLAVGKRTPRKLGRRDVPIRKESALDNLLDEVIGSVENGDPRNAATPARARIAWKSVREESYKKRNHQGRALRRLKQTEVKEKLEKAAASPSAFWKLHKQLAKPVLHQTSSVSAQELAETFIPRMNPPDPETFGFSVDLLQENALRASTIPRRTQAHPDYPELDQEISPQDITRLKQHLAKHGLKTSVGVDEISKETIMRMDDERLRQLFNECLRERDAPAPWLKTIITGIPKRGKSSANADNYRTIALESCLLKAMTLLIHLKFTEVVERTNILPPSQNGFRPGRRTNNNVFILRTLIDKALAEDNTLYIAFVDISNAFPSTNHDSLWMKMEAYGLTGIYFDWIRMLYAKMTYIVMHNGELSEEFKALAGVLIGDPLSPTLWNLFLSTFTLEEDLDDMKLLGYVVSHLEHADDMAIVSRSPQGLQNHLNSLCLWCRKNLLILNALKSIIMIYGKLPRSCPTFHFNGDALAIAGSAKYIGVQFQSTNRDYFESHTASKVLDARKSTGLVLSLQQFTGQGRLPPSTAKTLYLALVDCHLIHAADVAPDVTVRLIEDLERTQRQFLRCLLQVTDRSSVAALHTETGILPIAPRRVIIGLRYLMYVISLPPDSYMAAALAEAQRLRSIGHFSWLTDLEYAVRRASSDKLRLPDLKDITGQSVAVLIKNLEDQIWDELVEQVNANGKLYLLHNRLEPLPNGRYKQVKGTLRHYLTNVPVMEHRKTLTKLLLGESPFRLAAMHGVPLENRVCRLCTSSVESPEHVLLQCRGSNEINELRNQLWVKAEELDVAKRPAEVTNESSLVLLKKLVFHFVFVKTMARFIHNATKILLASDIATY